MRLLKKHNPYGVAIGQVWKRAKRNDRPNKLTIVGFEKRWIEVEVSTIIGFFAVVEYGKGKNTYSQKINLLNFNNYKLIK